MILLAILELLERISTRSRPGYNSVEGLCKLYLISEITGCLECLSIKLQKPFYELGDKAFGIYTSLVIESSL